MLSDEPIVESFDETKKKEGPATEAVSGEKQ